ncbi:MAG: primosomal protein N', partial [Elusimicrobia bacterium]|nr:primosomal protein N' [Elusimicrobiota bacterium]
DSPFKLKPAAALLDEEPLLSPAMMELGLWLSRRYLCSPGEGLFALLPPGAGAAAAPDSRSSVSDETMPVQTADQPPVLTHDQSSAAEAVHRAVFSGKFEAILLRGVAAAGKTEVYFSAIRDVLTSGRAVLYLVPEIGLATQAADALKKRFGEDNVLVWHSDLPLKERRERWWRIRGSEAAIVVGARSAALAPLPNIGLIVVDEEQDSAFKEDRKPRFHARDVAMKRARDHEAVVVFGSATPSLELYHLARAGGATFLRLNERAVAASAPVVRIVDLKKDKARGALSAPLKQAIGARLKRHEQTILFLNRRGFHRFLRCPECGWVARCPRCGIAFVHHKRAASAGASAAEKSALDAATTVPPEPPPTRTHGPTAPGRRRKRPLVGSLVCHLCGAHEPIPAACPECRHLKLHAGGTGTERVAEEVVEEFPWARTLRWDSDSAARRGANEEIFREFLDEKADVLIGTQLVAQGFNFPHVTLVGVVDADVPLHLPDFRASERAFQLVMQVGGRAGRELVTGDVLIQTRNADHYALAFAERGDYDGFADAELRFREDLNYPPFTRLVLIRTESKSAARAESDLAGFLTWLADDPVGNQAAVLGPTPTRGDGAKQLQCLLKVPTAVSDQFLETLRGRLSQGGPRLWVDVDPQNVF